MTDQPITAPQLSDPPDPTDPPLDLGDETASIDTSPAPGVRTVPTVEDVMAAGFTREAAERIVAREEFAGQAEAEAAAVATDVLDDEPECLGLGGYTSDPSTGQPVYRGHHWIDEHRDGPAGIVYFKRCQRRGCGIGLDLAGGDVVIAPDDEKDLVGRYATRSVDAAGRPLTDRAGLPGDPVRTDRAGFVTDDRVGVRPAFRQPL